MTCKVGWLAAFARMDNQLSVPRDVRRSINVLYGDLTIGELLDLVGLKTERLRSAYLLLVVRRSLNVVS